ncbi:DUF2202 domain-containing protein [uncultured Wocania sp.]|uniref:DUF2202 domain-containing protein n=1 Tax=uncultured Wocania sp. TaxID=2834404 RepID=UPI0030F56CDD
MRKPLFIRAIPVLILAISLAFLSACSDNNDDINDDTTNQTLTEADKAASLFMLEEEKLARDTYAYLDNLWSVNQFANIKNSEQTHMDSVEGLLIQYNIKYTILPFGEFVNQDMQNLYNQFVIDGAISQANALQIGATIEDLDIVDLETNINATNNTEIISVFGRLQCGSRNHLRSFVSAIENSGSTYEPQFLTQEEFDSITNDSHEQCN